MADRTVQLQKMNNATGEMDNINPRTIAENVKTTDGNTVEFALNNLPVYQDKNQTFTGILPPNIETTKFWYQII